MSLLDGKAAESRPMDLSTSGFGGEITLTTTRGSLSVSVMPWVNIVTQRAWGFRKRNVPPPFSTRQETLCLGVSSNPCLAST